MNKKRKVFKASGCSHLTLKVEKRVYVTGSSDLQKWNFKNVVENRQFFNINMWSNKKKLGYFEDPTGLTVNVENNRTTLILL